MILSGFSLHSADDGLESDCENEKTLREDPGKVSANELFSDCSMGNVSQSLDQGKDSESQHGLQTQQGKSTGNRWGKSTLCERRLKKCKDVAVH